MNSLKLWVAFSIGVAAGAGVALIYAPQTGAKTRKQIRKRAEDATDYIKDQADTLTDQAAKVYKRSKDAAGDYTDDLVDTLQSKVKSVRSSF